MLYILDKSWQNTFKSFFSLLQCSDKPESSDQASEEGGLRPHNHLILIVTIVTKFRTIMHQSIESPGGGGGPGWGGDSAPTFCTILHSPRPPRHIFLSLIPAPGAQFLKAHIHISSYESNKLQEQDAALLVLSVIP